jgi:L-asparaginase / beta-aspartyl-peptidase
MPIAIIVHGGAGQARPEISPDAARVGCLAAARLGHAVLRSGGSALDAVETAVAAMEDDPQFNAGVGSCLNADGEVEMDAAIMSGADLRVGAVALVRDVRNPVRLARAVMERTPHVFLAGEGAHRLAEEAGLPLVEPRSLITERMLARWREVQGQRRSPDGGTVGAAAIDPAGHVAAATSTGGMLMKRAGRIGDSPLCGCGTYADDESGAASATGHGEAIIRVLLTRVVCEHLRTGKAPDEAARAGVAELERVHGQGGVILVDRQGRVGAAFNTARMSHAWIDTFGREGTAFEGEGRAASNVFDSRGDRR